MLGTPSSFIYRTLLHMFTFRISSILIRPTTRNENLFNVGVVLRTGDAAPLAQPKALVDYIHRSTERHELQFGEFKWLSYFRFVWA